MVEAVKGKIDGPGAVDGWGNVPDYKGLANKLGFAVGERVGSRSTGGMGLEARILAAENGGSGKVKEGEE